MALDCQGMLLLWVSCGPSRARNKTFDNIELSMIMLKFRLLRSFY